MAALVVLSLLGIIICLVMLIISAIKKNGNVKKWGIGIAICFVLMIIGAVNSGSSNETMSPSASTTAVSDADKAMTMVDVTTDQGVTLKLPSDVVKKSEIVYSDDNGNAFVVNSLQSSPEEPISAWFKEAIVALFEKTYTDVKVTSFENGITINGHKGLVAFFSGKTKDGQARGGAVVMLANGVNDYIFNFLYRGENSEGFFAKNLQESINSIQLPAK